jgi:hypothetical protein
LASLLWYTAWVRAGKPDLSRSRRVAVTRKQIVLVVLLVVVASSLSALVAYRRALHRANGSMGTSADSAGCLSINQASQGAGQVGCVTGRVLRVYTSRGGNTFLDFCADYRNCPFTSVIFASDRDKFGNLQTLSSRRVEIRGAITSYQGRSEIIIRDPEQLHEIP